MNALSSTNRFQFSSAHTMWPLISYFWKTDSMSLQNATWRSFRGSSLFLSFWSSSINIFLPVSVWESCFFWKLCCAHNVWPFDISLVPFKLFGLIWSTWSSRPSFSPSPHTTHLYPSLFFYDFLVCLTKVLKVSVMR